MTATWRILAGDCRTRLHELEPSSVQTCVTSPPYYGLRDYGTGEWTGGDSDCGHVAGMARKDTERETPGGRGGSFRGGTVQFHDECGKCGAQRVDKQLGLEQTPDQYVAALVAIFQDVRRVLRDDGTVWLNLGDSYCSTDKWGGGISGNTGKHTVNGSDVPSWAVRTRKQPMPGVKPKDLLGIPWMVAFALRADGWYLRSDIIWNKPNPMPESVTDRPTKSHEYVFLLSKGPRYFYDADAIREPHGENTHGGNVNGVRSQAHVIPDRRFSDKSTLDTKELDPRGRNKRSVWTVATQPYPGAHFATFPPKLIEPCVLAGTSPKACGECGAPWRRVTERESSERKVGPGTAARQAEAVERGLGDGLRTGFSGYADGSIAPTIRTIGWEPSCAHHDDSGSSVVLDPFSGSGTTGLVALRHNRSYIGIELSPEYVELSRWRIRDDAPLLNTFNELEACA